MGQLTLTDISKHFRGVSACTNINLDIRKGELFYLLGPSGCGKSTLLNLVAGLLRPDTGDISLDGHSILSVPPHKRPVHTIFQNYALFPHMTVLQNVGFPLRMRGAGDVADRVTEVLALVNLSGFESRYPGELSGGQQQRVAIARAIINEPAILLLDEPFGALDAKLRDLMQLELKRLQRKLGTTFICVSHDQAEALSMADRVAVMNHGHIEQVGTPEEIYTHPQSRFVAEFIGDTNLFTGEVVSENTEYYTIKTTEGFQLFSVKSHKLQGKDVYVSLRPERMEILAPNTLYAKGIAYQGSVREIIYTGPTVEFMVNLDKGPTVRVSAAVTGEHSMFGMDERVAVGWEPHDVVLIPRGE